MAVKIRLEFDPGQFVDTPDYSAQVKAEIIEKLAQFVESGFSRKKFTHALYTHMDLHLSGDIAHFDIDGFYDYWFSNLERQYAWVRFALYNEHDKDRVSSFIRRTRRSANPSCSWSDADNVFCEWLKTSGWAEKIRKALEDERDAADLAKLRSLIGPDAQLPKNRLRSMEDVRRRLTKGARVQCTGHTLHPELVGSTFVVSKTTNRSCFLKPEEEGDIIDDCPWANDGRIVAPDEFEVELRQKGHSIRLRIIGEGEQPEPREALQRAFPPVVTQTPRGRRRPKEPLQEESLF